MDLIDCYAKDYPIENKIRRLDKLVSQECFDPKISKVISRCPGRISLSKHADYINSDLLYVLDDRDLFAAVQLIEDPSHKFYGSLILKNSDENFPDRELDLKTLNFDNLDKNHWSFYVLKLLQELNLGNRLRECGLVIAVDSEIPVGGGLSSSHALLLSCLLALTKVFHLNSYIEILESRYDIEHANKEALLEILKLCQRIEAAKGFNSGLGDQSAQLLSKKGHFTFIKIFPELNVCYKAIPDDIAIISAPTFIKAEKSLPEFRAANENIALYKTINELINHLNTGSLSGKLPDARLARREGAELTSVNERVKDECNAADGTLRTGSKYLADLIYSKDEKEIFQFLENIEDRKVRGLALYGLAEAKRVSNLKQELNLLALGKHLNLSHQAELNFNYDPEKQSLKAFSEGDKLNYIFDPSKPLAEHCGSYRAGTATNDELHYLANTIHGVLGCSISGAGLGGNNTIICQKDEAERVKAELIESFYKPKGLEIRAQEALHISSSSAAAAILMSP